MFVLVNAPLNLCVVLSAYRGKIACICRFLMLYFIIPLIEYVCCNLTLFHFVDLLIKYVVTRILCKKGALSLVRFVAIIYLLSMSIHGLFSVPTTLSLMKKGFCAGIGYKCSFSVLWCLVHACFYFIIFEIVFYCMGIRALVNLILLIFSSYC